MKEKIDKVRAHWKNYIFQSAFAGAVVFIALLLFNVEKKPIVIASLGATAFVVFAMPKNITAGPRNVVGGYLVGIIVGSLCHLIPHHTFLSSMAIYALSVGISIFIMVVIDTEHPPALGIALNFAITDFSLMPSVGIMGSVIVLIICLNGT